MFEALLPQLPGRPCCAFLVGSMAEGLATSKSDVDFVAVVPHSSESASLGLRWHSVSLVGSRRCEIQLVDERVFRECITGAVSFGGESRLVRLHHKRKLGLGIPVFQAEQAPRLLEGFRAEDLGGEVAAYFGEYSQAWFESFADFYRDGRFDEALVCATRYLENTCEMALAAAGDLFFKDKWRLARVRRTFQKLPGLDALAGRIWDHLAERVSCDSSEALASERTLIGTWLHFAGRHPVMLHERDSNLSSRTLADRTQHVKPFALFGSRQDRMLVRTVDSAFDVQDTMAATILKCALNDGTQCAWPASVQSFVRTKLFRVDEVASLPLAQC